MAEQEEERPLKAIGTWLQGIKDTEIREKAIENAEDFDTIKNTTTSITNALFKAFPFSDTVEGFDYWSDALDNVRNQIQ